MARFCSNCGNQIAEGSVFCDNCGQRLADEPGQAPSQPYAQPNQPYAQPAQQYSQPAQQSYQPSQPYQQPAQQYQQPAQQPYQPSQPYQQPVQQSYQPDSQNNKPPKKKTCLFVGLGIAGFAAVAVIITIIIIAIILIPLFKSHGVKVEPAETPAVTERETAQQTDKPASSTEQQEIEPTSPTEQPEKEPTSAHEPPAPPAVEETAKPAAKQTAKPAAPKALPFANSLGKIKDSDFAWISDAMSGSLTGKFMGKNELIGKWKGEFIFDGIWELVYVTIDANGKISVEPYQINYGEGWEKESADNSYSFNGSFDVSSVKGSGNFGKINIYQFVKSNGTQYGVGTLSAKNGNQAKVYLVRP